MLELYLLRHAKSSWRTPFAADFDRPLSGRGRRAARRMAGYMGEKGILPDLVLCSPARRTRQTLKALSAEVTGKARMLFEPQLYGGSAETHLALIGERGGTAGKLLLIGHNPALETLALLLVGSGEEAARAALAEKFPAGALAHIAFDAADWSEAAPGSGRLVAFVSPRELE